MKAEKLQSSEQLHEPVETAAKGAGEKRTFLWMLGLALVAFVSRAVGLAGGLVFDDYLTVGQRTKIAWPDVLRAFFINQSQAFGSNFYRPVLNVWYEIVFRLFGRSAAGWHLASILLHVVCTLLVFRLALAVLENRSVAWIAAAFFAVHPAHVESVAWASAMGDPLMTAFLLLSVLAFLQWMKSGNAGWWIASFVAAIACVCSKEPGVMLPVVLAASAWACPAGGRTKRASVATVAPFFVLSLVFLVVRRMVLPAFSHHFNPSTSAEMIFTWPSALLFYLQHMFWPPVVVPFYPLEIVQDSQLQKFFVPLIALAVLAGVLGFLLWRAAGWRKLCFCIAWMAPLAPALYLKAFAPFELVHDRFLYAPLIGFCMALALVLRWAAEALESKTGSRLCWPIAIALILLWGFHSMSETLWWQSNQALFTRAVAVTPNNPRALVNLGDAYIAARRFDEAVPLFQRALAYDPQCANAMFGLGMMAWRVGDDARAESYLAQALRIEPRYDEWEFLAKTELRRKRIEAAEAAARQSIALDSTGEGAHGTLGEVLLAKGDRSGAIHEFQQELRLFPQNEEARAGLARAANTAN